MQCGKKRKEKNGDRRKDLQKQRHSRSGDPRKSPAKNTKQKQKKSKIIHQVVQNDSAAKCRTIGGGIDIKADGSDRSKQDTRKEGKAHHARISSQSPTNVGTRKSRTTLVHGCSGTRTRGLRREREKTERYSEAKRLVCTYDAKPRRRQQQRMQQQYELQHYSVYSKNI